MKLNINRNKYNIPGVAYNRLEDQDKTPREMWFTEGADFLTLQPKYKKGDAPYDVNIYKAIETAISTGIININIDTDTIPKGIYDNDEAAIAGGLIIGDIYELSETNTLDPTFYGLLKVVKPIIVPPPVNVLGTDNPDEVLGTESPDEILGIN